MTINREIKKRFDAIGNKESIRVFFKLIREMTVALDLNANNEKLAINVRNDNEKRISVNLNSHLVLSIKEGDEFGFKILSEDLPQIESLFTPIFIENFKSQKLPAVYIIVKYSDLLLHFELIKSLWLKSCEIYEPMIAKSRYRKSHIPELYELAIDESRLNDYLENTVDVNANSFKDVINDLAVYLKAEDNILSEFEINRSVFTKEYVWIYDGQQVIGDINAHYEIIRKANKLHTCIHFESKNKVDRDIFSKTINSLPPDLIWIPWHRSKSLEHKNPVDLSDSRILEKLAAQLLYFEENIGDQIRTILLKITESAKPDYKMNLPLNQILFGPPGTGKTYNTINKALQIINEQEEQALDWNNREKVKEQFDKRMETSQIVFTTFHQSMSYEDFIEGIKPIKPINSNDLHYGIVDGIFKTICNNAKRESAFSVTIDNVTKPLTKELFEEFYYSFSEVLPSHTSDKSDVELKTKENAPFELFKNTVGSIVVKAGVKRSPSTVSLNELILVLFENKVPTYRSYEQIIINKILEDKGFRKSEVDNTQKRFVIIIDEINRGNVSQIFGELITLIEEDKRMGRKEALAVTLPYSKEKFEVPQNVYIIGTMNTADRSVEALDAALRRRFHFEEISPNSNLINEKLIKYYIDKYIELIEVGWEEEPWVSIENDYKTLMLDSNIYDAISEKEIKKIIYKENVKVFAELNELFLEKEISFLPVLILKTLNRRIEKLLDKDHQIGHSYFMSASNLEDLKGVFQNKIIPLLQEYFFGDFGKIGLVLGKGFVRKKEWITKQESFAHFDFESVSDFEERDVFEIIDYSKSDLNYTIEINQKKVKLDFLKAIKLLLNLEIE